MLTHKIVRSYVDTTADALSASEAIQGDAEASFDGSFANGSDHEVDFAVVQATMKSLLLYADKACTIYTNAASGGSPQDTIPLAAGQMIVWSLAQDGLPKCPFSDDVTKFYVTNAAGITTVKVRAILDLTP